MNETRTLARFVVETRLADLPTRLVDNCKIAVLDAIGAGFVGSVQPWTRRIVSVVQALGGLPDASVIHEDWRAGASRAGVPHGVPVGAFGGGPRPRSRARGPRLAAAALNFHP